MRGALAVIGQMAVAVIIAVTVTAVSLVAIARVEWPAYNSSNQLHALTTVGQFACLAGLFACGLLWRRGRRALARAGTLVFLSAFSVVTLAMPLGATKLYLFGISVDQQFRTEYLTRLADSASLHDMTYYGLPPFYPPGWFWIGGRMAALSGTPAWEMFKPWAIISITVAIVLAFVLWAKMIRFEYALIVTTATAAATLAYSPTEPYAAVITVLLPPVFVLAWSGLRGVRGRGGGREDASRLGGRHRDGGVPRRRRAVLLAAARLRRVHAGDHGARARRSAPQCGTAAETARHRGDLGGHVADRLGPVAAGRAQGRARRLRHGAALPAVGGRAARVPHAALHPARCAVHARRAVAGVACPLLHPRGRVDRRRARRLRVVAAVDAHHAGRHHLAVVPAAADADGAAGRGGRIRLHRGHAGDRSALSARNRQARRRGRRGTRRDRRADVQPGHPRRAALRHRRGLHRHRRRRPTGRPSPAWRRALLPRDRREDPAR